MMLFSNFRILSLLRKLELIFNKLSTEELKEQMQQIIIEDPNILDGALKKVGLRVITDKE